MSPWPQCSVIQNKTQQLQIPTAEFTVDLGSYLSWRTANVPCLLPVTDVFPLQMCLTEEKSCFVREIIQLLCALCYEIRVLNAFDFRLLINEK